MHRNYFKEDKYMSLFKRKEKVEQVKVVFVPQPKQDLGTRLKNLDFDPFSLGVGAAVPAVGIGVYKGIRQVENQGVVKRFLDENPGFEPVEFGFGELKSSGGMLTLFPQGGTDGFFISLIKKS